MSKLGVALVLACLWPSLAAAESRIFISQAQITGGPGKTAEDFVELFNPSDTPVNLNGYRLVKRTETGTSDFLIKSWITDIYIPARGFYLWANSGFSAISAVPDITTSSGTISDNNGVALRFGESDIGAIVDSIAWGSANNGFMNVSAQNPGVGSALARQDLYGRNSVFAIASSSPRNTSVQDVAAINTSTPATVSSSTPETTTSTPEFLTTSTYVRVFRFMPNPSGGDSGQEWVELRNSDEQDVLLDGWMIDDSDTGNGPGSDAYVLSGIIKAGEIVRFVLPEGSFALNNSGGDEVNLYFADRSLAQKASYSATAYDDGIFEFRDSRWQPPVQNVSNNGGSSSGSNSSGMAYPPSPPSVKFKFNEIFANPLGDDAGKEWVEIYNPENSTSSLEGYFIADGQADAWGSSAWVLPKGYSAPPKGLLAITIPKIAFSLNNSGVEKLKLFAPDKYLLDTVIFKDAPENHSWAKNMDGIWEWSLPTPNLPNNTALELPEIYISELLPFPAGDNQEFVEIYNSSGKVTSLEGAVLQIGAKNKIFGRGEAVLTGGHFVVWEDDLPARLSNSGQTVRLLDSFGRLLSEAAYDKAGAGAAYATTDGKDYVWTGEPTPGKENLYVLGSSTERANVGRSADVTVKKPAISLSEADIGKLLASNLAMQERIAALEKSIDRLSQKIPDASPGTIDQAAREPEKESSGTADLGNRYLGLTVGSLGLLAIIFLGFKFGTPRNDN